MSEVRFNRITGDWVVIASDGRRPEDYISPQLRERREILEARMRRELDPYIPPARVPECPFCPGNEAMAETVARVDRQGDWGVRAVKSIAPLLSPTEEKRKAGDHMRYSISGFGYHEVVIEHPDHNQWLWKQTTDQVSDVFGMIRDRYVAIASDERVELIVPFKNHGRSAGTSLLHPHTQIVGAPIMASDVRRRVWDAVRFYDERGECLFCGVVEGECASAERLVHASPGFVSFIPYAALSPFHIMVFPTDHASNFGGLGDSMVSDFAAHLRTLLEKVETRLFAPDFNIVIRSVLPGRTDPRSYHWYMSIVPHVAGGSGLAMGSGMYVNSLVPEESASFLRGDASPGTIEKPAVGSLAD